MDARIGHMARRMQWDFPEGVVKAWERLHGRARVEMWAVEARARALECVEAWGLTIESFCGGGSLSCVLACAGPDGSPLVLKLLAPWAHDANRAEALALAAWQGFGVVALLESSPDGRALLLERVVPGTAFGPSCDERRDCGQVAKLLEVVRRVPAVRGLPPLAVAVGGRFARARRAAVERECVPDRELAVAQRRAVELAGTARRACVVHGDAQNKNLLLDGAGSRLVAIDPEPSLGDMHFDAALWALTHRPGEGVAERCALLADLLGLDADRLWSWCRALAVAEVALDVPERAQRSGRG